MQATKTRKTATGRKTGPRRAALVSADRGAPGEAAHIRAYGVLKEAVLAGQFRPGEVVTLRSLAKQLAIGEMPVREALRRIDLRGCI